MIRAGLSVLPRSSCVSWSCGARNKKSARSCAIKKFCTRSCASRSPETESPASIYVGIGAVSFHVSRLTGLFLRLRLTFSLRSGAFAAEAGFADQNRIPRMNDDRLRSGRVSGNCLLKARLQRFLIWRTSQRGMHFTPAIFPRKNAPFCPAPSAVARGSMR